MANAHIETQKNTADFVNRIVNGGEENNQTIIRMAMDGITSLITSRNQSDVDSGLDSLHVLTRFLDRKHSNKPWSNPND